MDTPLPIGRFVIPEKAVTHFHIKEGDQVADFGAGSGYFLKPLSQAVGEDGVVYACEIQKNLVETMGNVIEKEQLANVRAQWCDFEKIGGSKLQEDSLDVVIIVNTLFQVEAKEEVVAEINRVLRPGGKAIVIDWSESFGGLGPQPADVIDKEPAEQLFLAAGFTLETEFDAGDHHYGLTFRK